MREGKELRTIIEGADVRTPYYLVDIKGIRHNLAILDRVRHESGAKVLLAQKAFSMFSLYPLLREILDGTTASGLYEARLGKEEFGKETHVFSPAYREDEFDEILKYADDIVFNSVNQVLKYGKKAKDSGKSIGLRINPEYSTQEGHAIYDPCAPLSRLGTTYANFDESIVGMLDGLHFHTLCEQNSDDLISTFASFESKFGKYLYGMKWLNLGGGHHITRDDYDVDALIALVKRIKEKYDVDVYLEPGEAVVLNAGYLVSEVLDKIHNGEDIAILDTSAACHMPDVIEMPYRPPVLDSGVKGELKYTYRFGGPTCLAGDIIGDYSFKDALNVGDKVIFLDMALYTMVKNNTFNGMPLPSIAYIDDNDRIKVVKEFGYEDFKGRLS